MFQKPLYTLCEVSSYFQGNLKHADYRVYYEIFDPPKQVVIVAVTTKQGSPF